MSIHTYGAFTIDTTTLPAKSLEALISRGITHYLGNEQASKVSTWVKTQSDEGVTIAEDEKEAKKLELVTAAHAALLDGTIGTRVGGPKLDPLTKALRDIAGEEVANILKGAGQKVPKGKETVHVKGEDLTFADLVSRRIENPAHAERLAKAAKKRVAEAKSAGENASLDDL